MYRLLNVRNIAEINHKLLSHQNIQVIGINKYHRWWSNLVACPYLYNQNSAVNKCNISDTTSLFGTPIQFRQASTLSTDLIPTKTKKKKRRRKFRKFTELLQVTALSTKETKASVKNLKPKNLAEFIATSNILSSSSNKFKTQKIDEYQKYAIQMFENREALSMKVIGDEPVIFVDNKLHKMELTENALHEIIESYNTHKEEFDHTLISNDLAGIIEEPLVEEVGIEDPMVVIPEVLVEAPISNSKKNRKKTASGAFKSKYHRNADDEMKHKAKSLLNTLSSYLEMCVATGMVNRGYSIIMHYRYKLKNAKYKSNVLTIELFNILLLGFAEKGNWNRVKEILRTLTEENIHLSTQSYAAIFECLGRIESTPQVMSDITMYIIKAEEEGISMNDIMNQSKFVGDKREMVLSSIQMVKREFQPEYTPPYFYYANHLVDDLNENVISVVEKVDPIIEMTGSEIMDPKKGFGRDDLMNYAKEQIQTELNGYVKIKSIAKFPEATEKVLHFRKKWDELNHMWANQIVVAFHRDLNSLRSQALSQNSRALNLFPYLKALDVKEYADILLQEIRKLSEGSESYSPTVNILHRGIGKKVMSKFQLEQKKRNGVLEKLGEIYSNYCDLLSESNSSDNPRQAWQRLVHHSRSDGPSLDIVDNPWPVGTQIAIGRFLYNILIRDLRIDINCIRENSKTTNLLPAFYTLFRYHGKYVQQEVKPHPVLIKLLRGSQQEELHFDTNLVPMVCPPKPWIDPNNGGYLISKSDFIRLPTQAVQQTSRINETQPQNLYPCIDSLNQLASIPWKVNQDLLDIALEVFNNGGSTKLEVPQPPSSLPKPQELLKHRDEMTQEEKMQSFKIKLQYDRKQSEMYSLWCDALYRLSLANHFREKVFWLPHNMDFRGRVYPIPPHLNHLGSDLARSLLVFHKAKPLGVDGFSWLKLHCINLTGFKKRDSIRERLLYAEQIMDEILDSADNPLTGRMWWTKSDEPWQTLGACLEIAKVHRSGSPETFMSSYPIHQDGSCNGLQHYAALGRDAAGAYSVNLVPCDIPQDVYNAVAVLVEEARKKDAQNGNETARVLDGFVKRKVIKQTVMTTVYGVTRYGARLQIARQLKDIDEFPKDFVWQASNYLTSKTFESLREMFTSTKEIQDWFTECAKHISSTKLSNVEWCTPLGLPIVQPYNKNFMRASSKNKLTQLSSMDMFEKPNIMKQKNAFPPNFIHSLDSTHMMLTSLHCEKIGLTFISVHDCFWTHACTVPEMNKICREQFVALHSQPILEDLSKFLINNYRFTKKEFAQDGSVTDMAKGKLNRILEKVPKKGDFDLQNVLNSIYFFS